jgi:ABC-type multidrug transport system fused ATPase/permease subunit
MPAGRQVPQYPKVTIRDVLAEYWNAAKRYRLTIAITTITTTIPVITSSIITPLFYKHVFDLLSANTTDMPAAVPVLVTTILWILLLNGISWVSIRAYAFTLNHFQAGIMNRLRQRSFEYVIGHSYSFFSNTFSGSLVQKINRYMRSFERVTDRLFSEIIPLLVRVAGISIVLWYTQPVFAYAIIGWMAVFFILSLVFSRWKIPYDIRAAEVETRATGVLSDSLSNHATIQSFSRHEHEVELFSGANTAHTMAMKKKWDIAVFVDAIQALLNIGIEFLIFYIAIKYWSMGVVTVGTFVLIQMYIVGLMNNFWGWSRILRDLYEAFADAKEAVEILKLGHGVKDIPGALPLVVTAGELDLNDVHFSFTPKNPVLDGVSLKVKPGERIGLVGPSGAGKSTLVRLLLRLYDIQSGSITIDGQNVKNVTQKSLRESISFVPQDPILFHRSLRDNIKYGKTDATDEEVIAAAKLAHCHEFIQTFPSKYDTFVGERGVKLSGGERQRVAIARAILKNSPILILDEATSSLDSHSEMLIQDALDNLMKGKTVMVIAHRLSTIRKMDRIVVIDHGKIIEEGSHEELANKEGGLYAKLWSLQSQGFIGGNESEEEGESDSDSK